jgi:hypothetical protein
MDEQTARKYAEAHGKAVLDGNMEHLKEDIVPELHPMLEQLSTMLPSPLTGVTVVSAEASEDHAESVIAYAGAEVTLQMKARWEDRDGRPRIVAAEPV